MYVRGWVWAYVFRYECWVLGREMEDGVVFGLCVSEVSGGGDEGEKANSMGSN